MSSSDVDTVTYNGINSIKGLELLENSEPVKVSVGSSGNMNVWYLPKKLVVEYSTFFAAALNGNFAEGKTHCVTLPEEDPDIFRIFVQWLYRGAALSKSDSTGCYELPEEHVRAWALGDKLGCSKLQDTAMLHINKFHEDLGTCAKEMHMIYEITPPGSRLRKFAIDEFRWYSDNTWLCDRDAQDDFFDMGAFTPEIKDDYWYATTHMSEDVHRTNPTEHVGRYLEDPKFRVDFGHLANECPDPDLHQFM